MMTGLQNSQKLEIKPSQITWTAFKTLPRKLNQHYGETECKWIKYKTRSCKKKKKKNEKSRDIKKHHAKHINR